ncbi:helix-turn-helix domain-containing protein [Streptomyces sp. NPDC090306]|uniref:helix-turn-helix domain-containing protein n=1 Tax=Streptomyces sp. NPDC090306 TaxID=3365961 RepID=UPI003825049B
MTLQTDVRDFLTSRRARITPEQLALPAYGRKRRVPGLRREEVALLAGMSVDYYNQLERGNLRGVSESVLVSVARVLRLDEAEHSHLFDLWRAANAGPSGERRTLTGTVRPGLRRLLDAMTEAPAGILNHRMDILAANRLGRALFSDVLSGSGNLAHFAFLDPRGRDLYADWDEAADDAVAVLRTATGSNPEDPELSALVAELSTRSEEFRTRWAAYDVRFHRTGTKRLHHPVAGVLDLSFEAMDIAPDPGLVLLAYTAPVGSPSADALRTLANWAVTQERGTDAERPETDALFGS